MPKPSWFGESIVINVANPAAGNTALIQPPGGTMWHVLSITANFLAGAGVGNRYLNIAHVNGVVDTGILFNSTVIVAAGNWNFECSSLFTGIPYTWLSRIVFPL